MFPQKFSDYYYVYLYSSYYNNNVGLIHPTPDIQDSTEDEIPDNYVVDTMVDDSLEAIEL